jgi:hypothetical protein
VDGELDKDLHGELLDGAVDGELAGDLHGEELDGAMNGELIFTERSSTGPRRGW